VPGDRRPAGRMHSWFRPGSGPLVRTSDRLGSVARALLAVSLFAAVPIALTAASATYTHVRAVATAQAGERHSVSVTLVEDVPAPPDEAWSNPPNEEATAAWADPAGVEHDMPVSVPAGTRAGSTVSVWIDRDGNRTPHPSRAEMSRPRPSAWASWRWAGCAWSRSVPTAGSARCSTAAGHGGGRLTG
jgi:hypothetical protein